MATDSATRAVTNTLTTTLADVITLTQGWNAFDVTNHHATEKLYFCVGGATAVAADNNNGVVLGGQSKVVAGSMSSAGTMVISVIGNGNLYTIEGVI